MIDGSDLRDFYINAWRNIPELVAAMKDEDEGMIQKHTGTAKTAKSLQREVLEMPEGAIFVAYQGFSPGRTKYGEITVHEIAAFVRPASIDGDETVPFGRLMIDAIPVGSEQAVRYLEPHVDADPMNMPRFERVSTAQLTFDIWKLSFSIPEHFA